MAISPGQLLEMPRQRLGDSIRFYPAGGAPKGSAMGGAAPGMTPQDHFMVAAPVAAGREAALRLLLASMNAAPGTADPGNAVVPFGAFERLHFARLVILDDALQADLRAHGVEPERLPACLAFIGDCDGPAGAVLADMAARAGPGLRRIFAHCEGWDEHGDLLAWMRAHDRRSAASYVNWVGRTVLQIREEHALQRALAARVPRQPATMPGGAERVRKELRAYVAAEIAAGRLALTPPAPPPLGWKLAKLAHLVAVPLLGLLAMPFLILLSPFLVVLLRMRETRDPEVCPRPAGADLAALREQEDLEISNQYTALGPAKPGRFRRWLLSSLLVVVNYACRHICTRGFLGRVQTIHFAHWIFFDDKTRVVFVSNYDGSHQGYMDDFINKVGWGLNLIFSNGVGWPRTRWLVLGGARIEQKFKYFQRRHQVPTQVWYKAYPGLALVDMKRNHRIREGIEQPSMTDAQALAWLRLL
ncbi:MAG TPA: hypothetical protein VFJ16_17990 [Longimicrobium sp.]|nr:hypothetical protein [Longimicrobium sp.]